MTDISRGGEQTKRARLAGLSLRSIDGAALADDHFRKILDALPAAIYTTDSKGRITYFNEQAVALWGCRPEIGKAEFCGSWKLYWPNGEYLPHDQCPMAVAIKEKRPIRGMEGVVERPDGTRMPFIPFPTPLFGPTGELVGAVNMFIDISDRKKAEQNALRLASIVESCDDAIISKNLDGTILSWNYGAARLFGYSAEEAIGESVIMLIPEDRRDEEPAIIERVRRGERMPAYETVRRHKDGSLIEVSLSVSPVKDGDGVIIGASKVARDITERKRAQEHKNLLLFEMKHRIKNTLATVLAIARQTMSSATADERRIFTARLQSLGSTYDLLTSEQWDRARLNDVIAGALQPFQENRRERFLIEGPDDVWLDSNKSLGVAMTLHELATNAVKYGALSNSAGRVSITWDMKERATPRRVRLHWKERGGPPVTEPTRKGFGSALIEQTLGKDTSELRLIFDPRGLEYLVEIEL
jgi:PAS domain S-box-containing protein